MEQAEEKGKEQREIETCQEVGDKMKDRADHPLLGAGKKKRRKRQTDILKDRQPRRLPEISLALFAAMPLLSSPLVRLSPSLSSAVCVQSGWPWLCSKPNARFLPVAVPTDPSSSPFTSLALFSSARRDCGTSAGGPHRWSTGTLLFAHVCVAPA